MALVMALVGMGPASAQAVTATGAGLRGSVVDAETGAPLEGATVALDPLPLGIVAPSAPGAPGFLSVAKQATTGPEGSYRFERLAQGSYRLRVVRIGYASRSIEVRYDGPANPTVSIGLEVDPVQLEPLSVVGRRVDDLTRAYPADPGAAATDRIALERLRQLRYLQGDARVLSGSDVLQAVTLGETDLLRTLHRLPGVSAHDDWSAEPWTRGARWDETRIYFDGLPLLDPLHAGGAFTSISPDAVGSLTFHPGVRPADVGSAAAGVVDMRTRPATGEERLSVLGQVSLLSGRVAVERPLGPGSGIAVSGRSSYLEQVTRRTATYAPESYVPLRFADFGGRFDHVIGDSLSLEVSGISTENEVVGDLSHELKGTRANWGNTALRGTLQVDRYGLRTRLTLGGSRYRTDVWHAPFDPERQDLLDAATSAPLDNRVRFNMASVRVEPRPTGASPQRWAVGAEEHRTSVAYEGPAAWPYPDAVNAGSLTERAEAERTSVWGTLRERLSPTTEVSFGLRLDIPKDVSRGGREVRAAPRLAGSWQATHALRVSGAIGRHHQYEQALTSTGFEMGPALVPGHLWALAGGDVPAIRSDLGTLGAELWLGDGWLASANAYARTSSGHLTPPPDSGFVRASAALANGRVAAGWVRASTDAVGLELGARKLSGRWTASASYSVSRARTQAGETSFTAPGDRPQVLDATFLIRASERLRIGAAYTAASGAPYTRFYSFRCPADPYPVYCPPIEDAPEVIGYSELAGGRRTPSYASLDLYLERDGTLKGRPFGLYLQIRNALNRDNRSAYAGSILVCGDVWDVDCTLTDHFDDGMPLFPLLGFWIRL